MIDDIQIRQASNSLRIYCSGRHSAGEFDVEVRSGSIPQGSSMLAVLGHLIADHEIRCNSKNNNVS